MVLLVPSVMLPVREAQRTRSPCHSLNWIVFDVPSAMPPGTAAFGTHTSTLVVSPNWMVLLVPSGN